MSEALESYFSHKHKGVKFWYFIAGEYFEHVAVTFRARIKDDLSLLQLHDT